MRKRPHRPAQADTPFKAENRTALVAQAAKTRDRTCWIASFGTSGRSSLLDLLPLLVIAVPLHQTLSKTHRTTALAVLAAAGPAA
jgi:hypothetical protein